MPRGRTTALTIHLAVEARQTLMAWQRSTTIPAGRARRGRMLLLLADGIPMSHIAKTVGISRRFVYTWAKRFVQEGLEGLEDTPGHGRGRRPVVRMSVRLFASSAAFLLPEFFVALAGDLWYRVSVA